MCVSNKDGFKDVLSLMLIQPTGCLQEYLVTLELSLQNNESMSHTLDVILPILSLYLCLTEFGKLVLKEYSNRIKATEELAGKSRFVQ